MRREGVFEWQERGIVEAEWWCFTFAICKQISKWGNLRRNFTTKFRSSISQQYNSCGSSRDPSWSSLLHHLILLIWK